MAEKSESISGLPQRRPSLMGSRKPDWANTWALYAQGVRGLPGRGPRVVRLLQDPASHGLESFYQAADDFFVEMTHSNINLPRALELPGEIKFHIIPQLPTEGLSIRPLGIASLYESRLHETQRALQTAENEKIIEEACGNRDLIAALMGDEWLGLRLLAQLRISKAASATSLRSSVGATLNSVAVGLAQLVRYGAADVEDGFFVITARGSSILTSIEKKSGVILKP